MVVSFKNQRKMVNETLLRYFKVGTDQGFSYEELHDSLIKQGYSETDIKESWEIFQKPAEKKEIAQEKKVLESEGPGEEIKEVEKKATAKISGPDQSYFAKEKETEEKHEIIEELEEKPAINNKEEKETGPIFKQSFFKKYRKIFITLGIALLTAIAVGVIIYLAFYYETLKSLSL